MQLVATLTHVYFVHSPNKNDVDHCSPFSIYSSSLFFTLMALQWHRISISFSLPFRSNTRLWNIAIKLPKFVGVPPVFDLNIVFEIYQWSQSKTELSLSLSYPMQFQNHIIYKKRKGPEKRNLFFKWSNWMKNFRII